ncbi:hypothetical protein DFH94DRAFT_211578 [Russula ochroleuca]|jgi:hypothetical protein|uniref:Uncharacterized protein n=1 Tax=Russula ochroleuca TaxID=152965 RepID=A0A9P5JZA0_9AGAM|nr:hypothetical protein DFH94DRAFT_211578 [Russula ochroleuca]
MCAYKRIQLLFAQTQLSAARTRDYARRGGRFATATWHSYIHIPQPRVNIQSSTEPHSYGVTVWLSPQSFDKEDVDEKKGSSNGHIAVPTHTHAQHASVKFSAVSTAYCKSRSSYIVLDTTRITATGEISYIIRVLGGRMTRTNYTYPWLFLSCYMLCYIVITTIHAMLKQTFPQSVVVFLIF